jgi:ankyrin repeat protein
MELPVCNCNESLLTASFDGCEKCVDAILLKCKLDIDFKTKIEAERTWCFNFDALYIAARKNNTVIVKKILESGLNVNIDGNNLRKNIPLLEAAFNGNTECIKLLVDAGSNINLLNDIGVSVLHAAFFSDNLEAMAYLIDLGSNRNIDVDNRFFERCVGRAKNHDINKKFLLEYVSPGEFTKPCRA